MFIFNNNYSRSSEMELFTSFMTLQVFIGLLFILLSYV